MIIEYNSSTHYLASELRSQGVNLPPHITDNSFVEKSAVDYDEEIEDLCDELSGGFSITTTTTFYKPFHIVEEIDMRD